MKCLQLKQPGSLIPTHTALPQPGPGEVLLRVTRCALCRTDAKMFAQGHRDLTLPRVLGHEICGVEVATGQRYAVWPGSSCGSCTQCRNGRENLCRQMQILGFHRNGGLAEFVAVPRTSLIPLPADLPDALACLAEPLACALNAIEQTNLRGGQKLLIYGAGPVGLLMAMAATARGAATWMSERSDSKLKRSDQFRKGLNIASHDNRSDLAFDAVINAAPAREAISAGIKRLTTAGCYCVFSGITNAAAIPVEVINEIHYRQLRMVGAYGCTSSQLREAVTLLWNHRARVNLLIERHIGLNEVEDALRQILAGKTLKFVVKLA